MKDENERSSIPEQTDGNEDIKTCSSCNGPYEGAGPCRRCGWDSSLLKRSCVRCQGPVDGNFDRTLLKFGGVASVIVWIIIGYLFGAVGVLTVGFAAAAVASAIMALTFNYRCLDCNRVVSDHLLSQANREDIHRRKLGYVLRTTGFAFTAVISAVIYLSIFSPDDGEKKHEIGEDVPGKRPADNKPDIAALERNLETGKLISILENNPDYRYQAAKALGRIGPDSIPSIITVMRTGDEFSKRAAIHSLDTMAPDIEAAINELIETVKTHEGFIRSDAIAVLGKAGPSAGGAVQVLKPLLSNYNCGRIAMEALKKIDPGTDWESERKRMLNP